MPTGSPMSTSTIVSRYLRNTIGSASTTALRPAHPYAMASRPRLTSRHSLPDIHGICPPTLQARWPIAEAKSDSNRRCHPNGEQRGLRSPAPSSSFSIRRPDVRPCFLVNSIRPVKPASFHRKYVGHKTWELTSRRVRGRCFLGMLDCPLVGRGLAAKLAARGRCAPLVNGWRALRPRSRFAAPTDREPSTGRIQKLWRTSEDESRRRID